MMHVQAPATFFSADLLPGSVIPNLGEGEEVPGIRYSLTTDNWQLTTGFHGN
jgi:hypothetical protein